MPNGFSFLAKDYDRSAIVQRSMGFRLLSLVDISPTDDILDVGCGTGFFSRLLASKTKGKVLACDMSESMIQFAREQEETYPNLQFLHCPIESFDAPNSVDFIFANSSLEWLEHPDPAMLCCYQALRPRGIMAIQTLAFRCKNFVEATRAICQQKDAEEIMSHFNSPWFHFSTLDNYKAWLTDIGFKIVMAKVERIEIPVTVSEAFAIFKSFEVPGFLNPGRYQTELPAGYLPKMEAVIESALSQQANAEGMIMLEFDPVFLLVQR